MSTLVSANSGCKSKNKRKKRAIPAGTEITQGKLFAKYNITNYNTDILAKEVDAI